LKTEPACLNVDKSEIAVQHPLPGNSGIHKLIFNYILNHFFAISKKKAGLDRVF